MADRRVETAPDWMDVGYDFICATALITKQYFY